MTLFEKWLHETSQAMPGKKGAKSRGLKSACWKGYKAVGTKKKNGKTVPNCVKS